MHGVEFAADTDLEPSARRRLAAQIDTISKFNRTVRELTGHVHATAL